MSTAWYSSCRTDVGRVRRLNEDGFVESPENGVWLVADGMGGHDAGDVACGHVLGAFDHVNAPGAIEALTYDARIRLYEANRRIREEAARRGADTTMGSTVVVFLAREQHCACLWAGDSRAYVLRGGVLSQFTRDHSAVEELIQSGALRREDAADHPHANVITRAVGAADQLVLDENTIEAEPGDKFLLCSDGLNKELSDSEIAAIMNGNSCRGAADQLIETTLARGGRDNVTVAVIEFPGAADVTVPRG